MSARIGVAGVLIVAALALTGCPPRPGDGNDPNAEGNDPNLPADPNDPNDPNDANEPNVPDDPNGTALAPALRASQFDVVRIYGDKPAQWGHDLDILDFNGDGQDDLLVRSGLYAKVYCGPIPQSIGRHNACATLDATGLLREATVEPGDQVLVAGGDLDGDGADDVLAVWESGVLAYVMRGGTPGTITLDAAATWAERTFALLDLPGDGVTGVVSDADGDGQDDIVIAYSGGLLVGRGPRDGDDALLEPASADLFVQLSSADREFALGVTDFERDGTPELVFGSPSSDTWVFPGDLAGEVPAGLVDDVARAHIACEGSARLADLNADGVLDVLLGDRAYSGALTGVINDCDAVLASVPTQGVVLRTRDWNDDGRDDLVATAGIYFGRAGGASSTEGPDIRFLNDDPKLGGPVTGVTVGDLDGNGVNDLVWASAQAMGYGGIVILRDAAVANPTVDPDAPAEWPAGQPAEVVPVPLAASDFPTARISGSSGDQFAHGLEPCDFNGDGIDDLLVTADEGLIAWVFAGPLAGELDEADAFATIDASAYGDACSAEAREFTCGGDLNGDGRDDVVFFVAGCLAQYDIVLGTASASDCVLAPGAAPAGVLRITTDMPPRRGHRVVAADVDGDGQADFIDLATEDGRHSCRVVHGPVTADFELTDVNADLVFFDAYADPYRAQVAVGRVHADEAPVLLLYQASEFGNCGGLAHYGTAVLPGSLTGAYECSDLPEVAILFAEYSGTPAEPAFADLTGDGYADFLLGDRALAGWRTGIENAREEAFVFLPEDLLDVPARDWNGDGRDDLVTYDGVHFGRGRGQIPDSPDIEFVNDDEVFGPVVASVAIGDFDGDGAGDMAWGNPFVGHGGVVIVFGAAP